MYEKKTLSALNEEFSTSEKNIKLSRTISKSVSTILIISGAIGALVVPMLGFLSSQSPSEPGDTTYIGDIQTSNDDITKHLADFVDHVGDYHNLETSYDNHVDENNKHVNNYGSHVNSYTRHLQDHDVADVLIEVDASDTYLVRVPPQIWYRTELRQGDTFWALPDASFNIFAELLSFEKGAEAPDKTDCSSNKAIVESSMDHKPWNEICRLTLATFTVRSEKFNISNNLSFTTAGDVTNDINIVYNPKEPITGTEVCVVLADHQGRKATRCMFSTPDNSEEICVWLRNAQDPEKREGSVAIDVKWDNHSCDPADD